VEAQKKIKTQREENFVRRKVFLGLFMLREEYNFDAETNDSETYLYHKLDRKSHKNNKYISKLPC
jgi:hypothetical protein